VPDSGQAIVLIVGTPKLSPAQPSSGAWREATVRNRKRVAQALCASQDFTGVINNTLGISSNL